MKHINDFIVETLLTEGAHLFKITASNVHKGIKLEDALKNFINNSKKRYSFTNKQDLQALFKDYCSSSHLDRSDLREFGLTSGDAIATLINNKKEELEKEGWKFDCIKTFDESEREKEYKAWKNSDDYVEGKKLDRNNAKEEPTDELTRTMVIYDVNFPGSPDRTLEYEFKGVRSANNMHQVHMLRMDWHHKTGGKYYDARECFLSYYLKKSDEELKERQQAWDDRDLDK